MYTDNALGLEVGTTTPSWCFFPGLFPLPLEETGLLFNPRQLEDRGTYVDRLEAIRFALLDSLRLSGGRDLDEVGHHIASALAMMRGLFLQGGFVPPGPF